MTASTPCGHPAPAAAAGSVTDWPPAPTSAGSRDTEPLPSDRRPPMPARSRGPGDGPTRLSEHWFTSLSHAQAVIETWRREYNEERPKKGLGGLTPAAYAKTLITVTSTAPARP